MIEGSQHDDVEAPTTKRGPAILVAVGALLIAVGPFLTFGSADMVPATGTIDPEVATSGTLQGIDTADGKFFVFIGIALLIMAVIMLSRASNDIAIAGLMFVIFGSGLVIYMSAVDLFALAEDLREELFRVFSGLFSNLTLEEFKETNRITVHIGPGLFCVVLGAVLALTGGLLALVNQTRKSPVS